MARSDMILDIEEVKPQGPRMDTQAMGLTSHTAVTRLCLFDSDSGEIAAEATPEHMLLVSCQPETLRIVHRRGAAVHNLALEPGDIALAPADVVSGWQWFGPAKFLLLHVDPGGLARFIEGELRTLVTGLDLQSEIVLHDMPLADAAEAIYRSTEAVRIGRNLVFDALARVFLVLLVQNYGARDRAEVALGDDLDVDKFRVLAEFVEKNMANRITVADLAEVVAMSESRFGRIFRDAMGRTPMSFVMNERIRRAKTLLLEEDLPLSRVAIRCGFSDQAHLTRSFKSATGMTPGNWRTRCR